MSHTPTPWYHDSSSRTIRSMANFMGEDERPQFVICRYPHRETRSPLSHEEWEGNPDFIVAAVHLVSHLRADLARIKHFDGINGAQLNRISRGIVDRLLNELKGMP